MELYILNSSYETIAYIDNADSVLWNKKFNDVGEAEIYIPCTNEMINVLKIGNYIYRYDDDMFCKITDVKIETNVENGDLDFSAVKSVNWDEYRGLPRENDQSYFYFMHDNLFKHVNIDLANTHLPDGTEPDSDKACTEYEAIIDSVGGQDLQLLGLGHNGHIGFNEPSDRFEKATYCVRAI